MAILREEGEDQRLNRLAEKSAAVRLALKSWAEPLEGNESKAAILRCSAKEYCFMAYGRLGELVFKP